VTQRVAVEDFCGGQLSQQGSDGRCLVDQTIKVQHVTVNDGGQAIVGNVSQGVGVRRKTEGNLMYLVERMNAAPRRSAKSKRSRSKCRAPAVRGWTVCRFHGARGGAPKGKANGNWKHGRYTVEARTFHGVCVALMRQVRKILGTKLA
jgi:hypothetical protein